MRSGLLWKKLGLRPDGRRTNAVLFFDLQSGTVLSASASILPRSHLVPGLAEVLVQMPSLDGRRASTMGLHGVSDGVGGRLSVDHIGSWLTASVCRAELVLSLGHDLAMSVWDSILRRASPCSAGRIRVSAMSDT